MADKRDDDITDLTEDEDVGGKGKDIGKGKIKNDKEPAQPAPHANAVSPGMKGKAKKGKKEKAKQGKKGGKLKLILILTPILLVAGFITALVVNLFGVRYKVGALVKDPILGVVVWFDPEFKSVDDTLRANYKERETGLDERETDIGKREAKIAERETELDSLETTLVKQESQLDRRGRALDNREEQMNQTSNSAAPLLNKAMSEQELADIQSLSRSYAQMDPGAAAGILVELKDEQHVAAILYHMVERNAAAILSVMEPVFAARITEILLQN